MAYTLHIFVLRIMEQTSCYNHVRLYVMILVFDPMPVALGLDANTCIHAMTSTYCVSKLSLHTDCVSR